MCEGLSTCLLCVSVEVCPNRSLCVRLSAVNVCVDLKESQVLCEAFLWGFRRERTLTQQDGAAMTAMCCC